MSQVDRGEVCQSLITKEAGEVSVEDPLDVLMRSRALLLFAMIEVAGEKLRNFLVHRCGRGKIPMASGRENGPLDSPGSLLVGKIVDLANPLPIASIGIAVDQPFAVGELVDGHLGLHFPDPDPGEQKKSERQYGWAGPLCRQEDADPDNPDNAQKDEFDGLGKSCRDGKQDEGDAPKEQLWMEPCFWLNSFTPWCCQVL